MAGSRDNALGRPIKTSRREQNWLVGWKVSLRKAAGLPDVLDGKPAASEPRYVLSLPDHSARTSRLSRDGALNRRADNEVVSLS